jgi:acetyltransferase-like isoleucine patch superfamily enzyme
VVLTRRYATAARGARLLRESVAAGRNTPGGRLRGFAHWGAVRLLGRPIVSGPVSRVQVSETAGLANVLINTVGGRVVIGDYAFFGHDVLLLTGTHDFRYTGWDRQVPRIGQDRTIVIESGAWIASRAVIIGPCRIGANAVIGCGCVVDFDVPPDTVVRVRQDIVMDPIKYSGVF